MKPLTRKHTEIRNFVCWEKRCTEQGWEFATLGNYHRDSDSIDVSNSEVLKARLRAVDPEGKYHDFMRASSDMVGWIEHLIVDPSCKPVIDILASAAKDLEAYPALDEDHWCQLEFDAHCEDRCYSNCDHDHCEDCGTSNVEEYCDLCRECQDRKLDDNHEHTDIRTPDEM